MQHLWSSSRADCSRSISSKSSERLVTPVLALPAADEEAAKWCPLDVAVGFDDKWVVEMGPLPPLLPFLILVSILRSKLGELSSERKLTLLAEKDLEAKKARFVLEEEEELDNPGSVHVDAEGEAGGCGGKSWISVADDDVAVRDDLRRELRLPLE